MELTLDLAYGRKLREIPKARGSDSFRECEPMRPGRATHPNSMGTEAATFGTLSDLALCVSGWPFICVLYHTL